MRKLIATLAITIMAGTHAASFVVNRYPSEHYYTVPLQKITQGYYGQGWSPRYLPRAQRNPNYDREDRQYEPGVITPYRHRFDQDYREFQSMEPYRRYPPRRQDWYEEED